MTEEEKRQKEIRLKKNQGITTYTLKEMSVNGSIQGVFLLDISEIKWTKTFISVKTCLHV